MPCCGCHAASVRATQSWGVQLVTKNEEDVKWNRPILHWPLTHYYTACMFHANFMHYTESDDQKLGGGTNTLLVPPNQKVGGTCLPRSPWLLRLCVTPTIFGSTVGYPSELASCFIFICRLMDQQLIMFCCPYLCSSSGRRHSWNCEPMLNLSLPPEDHSIHWPLFDWRRILILNCLCPVSCRVLWGYMVCLWSWKTVCSQFSLFLSIVYTSIMSPCRFLRWPDCDGLIAFSSCLSRILFAYCMCTVFFM